MAAATTLVTAGQPKYWRGIFALLHSLALHSPRPGSVHVYVFMDPEHTPAFARNVTCRGSSLASLGLVRAVGVPPGRVFVPDRAVFAKSRRSDPGRLRSGLNYVRFYLHHLLPPAVDRVLWVDADVAVLGDVREVFRAAPAGDHGWLCVARWTQPLGKLRHKYGGAEVPFADRYGRRLDWTAPSFNAGVVLFNLREWVARNGTTEAAYWLRLMEQGVIYRGSQVPLNIVVHGLARTCLPLAAPWHVEVHNRANWSVDDRLVHWAGDDKPWKVSDFERRHSIGAKRWARLEPPVCGGRGKCLRTKRHPCVCPAPVPGASALDDTCEPQTEWTKFGWPRWRWPVGTASS